MLYHKCTRLACPYFFPFLMHLLFYEPNVQKCVGFTLIIYEAAMIKELKFVLYFLHIPGLHPASGPDGFHLSIQERFEILF